MKRTAASGAVAALAAVLLVVPALPASAADAPGSWWYAGESAGGVPAAQQDGLTGKGVTIAVIDGLIDPDLPVFDGADLTVHDSACGDGVESTTKDPRLGLHATNVVADIIGNGTWLDGAAGTRGAAPGATVDFYSIGDQLDDTKGIVCSNGTVSGTTMAAAFDAAVADGADIISVSILQGSLTASLQSAIARALGKGVIILGGTADTQQQSVLRGYPAGANGVLGVGRHDQALALAVADGRTIDDSTTDVVAPGVAVTQLGDGTTWQTVGTGSGTSYATPIVAGYLALVMQKYPKATRDQVLQSVIRNTSAIDHPLQFDDTGYGYGIVSLGHMLRVDPTQYDDENPLITDSQLDAPSRAEIEAAAADATDDPTPTDTDTPDAAAPSDSGTPGWLLPVVIGGILLLLVIAGIVVAIVLATRKKTSTPG